MPDESQPPAEPALEYVVDGTAEPGDALDVLADMLLFLVEMDERAGAETVSTDAPALARRAPTARQ